MLGAFEKFLISKGYKVHGVQNGELSEINPEKYDKLYYSTMGHICFHFVKEGRRINFGLHEPNHPPVLVSPAPDWLFHDTEMDRIFEDYTFDEILNFCENGWKEVPHEKYMSENNPKNWYHESIKTW